MLKFAEDGNLAEDYGREALKFKLHPGVLDCHLLVGGEFKALVDKSERTLA